MRHGLSVLILTFAVGACAGPSGGGARAARAPEDFLDVPLRAADGQWVKVSALLGRRPALVSFWAPWCEGCLKEMAALDRLAQSMRPCGADVLGVAVGETPAGIAAFTRARPLGYPQFADEDFRLADALGRRRFRYESGMRVKLAPQLNDW
jgi:peroxiredoxin